ncbi:MAG: right-handed parallel beta-helix repeat-containing protein [Novosphingobium sp.]|jgi:Ca2+-binding RTX toxin-like protein
MAVTRSVISDTFSHKRSIRERNIGKSSAACQTGNRKDALTLPVTAIETNLSETRFSKKNRGSKKMSIINVSTAVQLVAAVKAAQPGDEIRVAPGQYTAITLTGIVPAGTVSITSADPANPAVFSEFVISSSSNIALSNLKMVVPDNSYKWYHFQINSSSNITVSNCVFDGPGLTPVQDTTGLNVRDSTGIKVQGCEFMNLVFGLGVGGSRDISVTNSSFHDIRVDGIRGTNNSQVNYSYNFFTNFRSAEGDHADAIQMWTTSTGQPATDITIQGNTIVRGNNGGPIQGIFIRDQIGTMPFSNVTVKDNIVIGGSYNSISLLGVVSGLVTGNSVVAFSDQDAWIRTSFTTEQLVVTDNTAFKYVTQYDELVDNALSAVATDGGLAALTAWSASHSVPGGFADWQSVLKAAGLVPLDGVPPLGDPAVTVPPPSDAALVNGTEGDDTLVADVTKKVEIHGNGGNDKIVGNAFGAKMLGGLGNDKYDVKGMGDLVQEDAGAGVDWVDSWIDYVLPDNVEHLALKVGGLKGMGNALGNQIFGSDGIDQLYGLGGNDTLDGGAGNDILNGGDGDDYIVGGAGIDKVWGGAGIDYFAFGNDVVGQVGNDEVMDFVRGVDKLDLTAIDANAAAAGDQAFRMIGTKNFSRKAGELQVKAYGDGVLVAGDVNGDGVADFNIWVHGVSRLSGGDFVL